MSFGHIWNCKEWNLVKNNYSWNWFIWFCKFFGLDFLNFLAHCVLTVNYVASIKVSIFCFEKYFFLRLKNSSLYHNPIVLLSYIVTILSRQYSDNIVIVTILSYMTILDSLGQASTRPPNMLKKEVRLEKTNESARV